MLRLIFKEIQHRKGHFVLSLLAVTIAVMLFVWYFTSGEASKRETGRIMREMGFNLRIIPKQTDLLKFHDTGYSEFTMPQDYVERFTTLEGLYYNQLLATLKKKIEYQGIEVLMVGLAPTFVSPEDKRKNVVGWTVDPGTVYLGYHLARRLNKKRGDAIEIAGKVYTIEKTLAESGREDDITFGMRLQVLVRETEEQAWADANAIIFRPLHLAGVGISCLPGDQVFPVPGTQTTEKFLLNRARDSIPVPVPENHLLLDALHLQGLVEFLDR